jgi:hypothetical protein
MQGSYTCTGIFFKYISGANKILFQGFLRGKSYPKLLLHPVLKALDECESEGHFLKKKKKNI